MKNIYTLALGLVLSATLSLPANACVDYWPDSTINVVVQYDSSYNEVLIRVQNLELFGGPNGAFCTCGITSFTDIYTNLLYIAFVDSGTFDPVSGFAVWDADANSGSAWNNLQPGDWNGYIAEVIAPGITTGDDVDLIIRAGLPPGYYFSLLDSAIVSTAVGTDEWDPNANDLAFSHNDVNQFWSYPITYEVKPTIFFTQVDGIVMGVEDVEHNVRDLILVSMDHGVPSISMPAGNSSMILEVIDAQGALLVQHRWDGSMLRLDQLKSGVFVCRVRSTEGIRTKKIVVSK